MYCSIFGCGDVLCVGVSHAILLAQYVCETEKNKIIYMYIRYTFNVIIYLVKKSREVGLNFINNFNNNNILITFSVSRFFGEGERGADS